MMQNNLSASHNSSTEAERVSSYLSQVLAFAIPKDVCQDTARRLLERFGSLDLVCSATVSELEGVEGVTRSVALLLRLCAALSSRRVTDAFELGKAHTTEEISRYFVALFMGLSVETVYMMLLDGRGRVTGVEYMGEGTVSNSDVYPRRLVERAVTRGAAAVILAHNHPRGSATASPDDVVATGRLRAVFKASGIELIDHYVVAERDVIRVSEE